METTFASAEPGPPERLPAMLGRYRPTAVLGTGRCSVVYRAHDPILGYDVAIKQSREIAGESGPTNCERLLAEARVLRLVACDTVTRVHDEWTNHDVACFVMDVAEGGTLMDRLMTGAVGDPWSTAAVGRCLRDALGSAHTHGIAHRDVSPVNLLIGGIPDEPTSAPGGELVGRRERFLLGDFGIASCFGPANDVAGQLRGARAFCAPEQRADGGIVGAATDVYSATAVIAMVLSGAMPPGVDDVADFAAMLRPLWRRFVTTGLHQDSAQRHPDIDSWYRALSESINHDLVEAGFDPID